MSAQVRRVEAVILNGVEVREGDPVKIRVNGFQRGIASGVVEGFDHDPAGAVQAVVRLEEQTAYPGQSPVRLLLNLDEVEAVAAGSSRTLSTLL